ncbi:heavy-metal-associated domain-containing protein [Alicyclobacillus macrosporangiidus]|uniref:Copper chaperone CopZ n=1 Tax=Alicyclobacillus macrosporangiidus TaxID=392015 RepID=A0A1I7FL43_9BACL|nr:heavy-metal-associated domain-containing protein [Alicyclobacillus macrosporangiidus]SFU36917.1 Copper chaperone CopZ [Alicyclobacillus macrosporangiidus]
MADQVFYVTGMSCAHCKQAVESALMDLPGVLRAEADVQTGRVVVAVGEPVDPQLIRLAVEEAGYTLAESGPVR